MPATTPRLALPYPVPGDAFRPASVDFPNLANALDAIIARNPAAVLAAQPILDVGQVGQIRAGRALAVADFTTLLGLATPVLLANLSDVSNLGSGGALTNKGAVPFGVGINGLATTAAVFAGSTGQALYIADTGAADPFRIRSGSWGAWHKTAKRGTLQTILSKWGATTAVSSFAIDVAATNVAQLRVTDGTTVLTVTGVTDVADDRWHHIAATFDGTIARLYVDGALESSGSLAAAMNSGATAPLDVGGQTADAGTAATNPSFGRADVAYVTGDVVSEGQLRRLVAAKVAHGQSYTPTRAHFSRRRRRRGGALVVGDFPASPRRLHNFTAGALTDAGLDNQALTNNGGSVSVAGADGSAAGGYEFVAGSTQYLSATDAGLPTGTSARTLGGWYRGVTASGTILSYGGATTAGVRVGVDGSGQLFVSDGTTTVTGPVVTDGQWHHVAAAIDNAAGDGLKFKLYLDGRLVASSTATPNALTGAGAGGFRVGRDTGAATAYLTGGVDGVFAQDTALSAEALGVMFAKGAGTVPAEGGPVDEVVQGFDATYAYILCDVRKRVSGRVNSDGTIAAMIDDEFRVVRPSAGNYSVYFAPGTFTTVPALTATVGSAGSGVTAKGASGGVEAYYRHDIRVVDQSVAVQDSPWAFTASGRGPLPSQDQLDLAVAA